MEEDQMTREQANRAAFDANSLIKHAAVAWYAEGHQQSVHLGYVEQLFRSMANELGFIVTPKTVITMEAAE
jgi:hypothetical protein